jgi:hypothetical protein
MELKIESKITENRVWAQFSIIIKEVKCIKQDLLSPNFQYIPLLNYILLKRSPNIHQHQLGT